MGLGLVTCQQVWPADIRVGFAGKLVFVEDGLTSEQPPLSPLDVVETHRD